MTHTKKASFYIIVSSILLIGVSSFMPAKVYSSAYWFVLWIAVTIALIALIARFRLWRNLPAFVMHVSFLCMIAGGFCSATFSKRGTLHLMPSETSETYIDYDGKQKKLPTSLTLLSFSPEYYTGMQFPKDFRSVLLTADGDTMRISMNNIGRYAGYRFYQSSYDSNGGTVLTVTSDPAGISVVYVGFLLFFISGAAYLIQSLKKKKRHSGLKGIAVTFFMMFAGEVMAVPAVDPNLTDSLAYKQVSFNGETVSFSTVATKFTYKLTGRGDVSGLSPEAFVASLIKYPEEWRSVPIIKIKSSSLRDALRVDGKYASVSDLYDNEGNYIPASLYEEGAGELDDDILQLDDRISLLVRLWTGDLFTPLPADSPSLHSKVSVTAEVFYNRIKPIRLLFILSIILSLSMLLASAMKKDFRFQIPILVLGCLGCGVMIWEWCISERFPLTNTADMIAFTATMVTLVSAYAGFRKYSQLMTGLGMLAASFLYLVAWLGQKDPAIGPVMPVLASPWLSVHVSLVMASYAILGFTLPVSVSALMLPRIRKELSYFAMSLLGPGTYLLGLGIITGAMWANVSWGRYWAWDPKETWALVTMLLYAVPLHRRLQFRSNPKTFHLYLIFAFASILMTYFGVNYLPSLHAYN